MFSSYYKMPCRAKELPPKINPTIPSGNGPLTPVGIGVTAALGVDCCGGGTQVQSCTAWGRSAEF